MDDIIPFLFYNIAIFVTEWILRSKKKHCQSFFVDYELCLHIQLNDDCIFLKKTEVKYYHIMPVGGLFIGMIRCQLK